MAKYQSQSPYEYELISAILSTDRIPDKKFELAPAIAELVIFEHLDKPYLTGNLAFLDDGGLFEEIDFQGSEQIEFTIGLPDSTTPPIIKQFIVRQIDGSQKTNDQAEMFILSLIDRDGFINNLINVNKSYEGKITDIVKKIVRDSFGANKSVVADKDDIQNIIRYIVPNQSPLEACDFLKQRATGPSGTPYYLYASMADNNVRFNSLENLLDKPAINTTAYRLSQTVSQANTTRSVEEQSYNISTFRYANAENLLALITNGDVGAEYEYVDTTTTLQTKFNFDVTQAFNRVWNTTNQKTKTPVFDNKTKFKGKFTQDYQSRKLTQITTSKTFDGISNYYEDGAVGYQKSKAISKAIRNFVMKSSISITVPGRNFFLKDNHLTTGNIIKCEFLTNKPTTTETAIILDQKRSGDYMIYAARHTFGLDRYEISLSLGKLANTTGNTTVETGP